MSDYKITADQIETSKRFFRDSDIATLTAVSRKFNKEQPNFTAVVLALEKHGINRIIVEDLLESIFIIYYVQTYLNKKSIPTISSGQLAKNVTWFGQFIEYYNQEKIDIAPHLSQLNFLRDEIVLNFAVETLHNLFGEIIKIPREVIFAYFALLKAIEIGAEKS